MIIPDWLFIVLAVLSVTLLLILLTCLVCACLARKRHRSMYKSLHGRKDSKKKPELSFATYDEPKYTYLPYTTAYTVQGSVQRSNSVAGSTGSDAPFYSPVSTFHPPGRRKGDAVDRTPITEGFRTFQDARRSAHLQTQSEGRLSSRPSSRRSSIGSTHSLQAEDSQSQKGVYLHSSLAPTQMNVNGDQDIVVSYDQDIVDGKPVKGKGRLEFSLYYDSVVTELIVTIKRVLDLPAEDGKDTLNPYVNFCIVPEDFYWQRTTIAENTLDPVFNETFHIPDVLHHKLREYTVCFIVMDADRVHGDRAIGKVMVSLSDLRAGVNIEMTKEMID